jgi:hypothetical protein
MGSRTKEQCVSFFALLKDGDSSADLPVIEECHLNLWSLAAIGPRRTMILDVGIRFKAKTDPVKSLRIAVPFQSNSVADLARTVLDTDLAELIFDTEVLRPSADTIELRNSRLKVVRIATLRSTRDAAYSNRDFTVWRLPLTAPLAKGEEGYVRVRFYITGTRSVWRWRRAWLIRTGAVVDLRICDIRRTVTVPGGEELRPDILDIKRVAAFIILPAWLYARSSSPAPYYVRLLEGPVWATYLARAAEIRNTSKLIVYSWRSGSSSTPVSASADAGISAQRHDGAAVSIARPFRIFLDLGREQKPFSPFRAVGYGLITTILFYGLFRINARPPVRTDVMDVGRFLERIPAWLGVTTVAGVVSFVLARNVAGLRSVSNRIRIWGAQAEATIFRKLPK